jgi:hypothetical protein
MLLPDLVTAAVIAVFLAPLVLIGVTTLTAPWWRSQVGRGLVTVEAAISLALLPPFVNRVTGGSNAATSSFLVFQASSWGVLALVLLRMGWVVVMTQRRGRRDGGRHSGI